MQQLQLNYQVADVFLSPVWKFITSNLTETVLKPLYLDNVKSVSDEPMRENSSSSKVVSNGLMGNNSQRWKYAKISTPEREIHRLLGNLTEVVAEIVCYMANVT
jgi:hypothetical protein